MSEVIKCPLCVYTAPRFRLDNVKRHLREVHKVSLKTDVEINAPILVSDLHPVSPRRDRSISVDMSGQEPTSTHQSRADQKEIVARGRRDSAPEHVAMTEHHQIQYKTREGIRYRSMSHKRELTLVVADPIHTFDDKGSWFVHCTRDFMKYKSLDGDELEGPEQEERGGSDRPMAAMEQHNYSESMTNDAVYLVVVHPQHKLPNLCSPKFVHCTRDIMKYQSANNNGVLNLSLRLLCAIETEHAFQKYIGNIIGYEDDDEIDRQESGDEEDVTEATDEQLNLQTDSADYRHDTKPNIDAANDTTDPFLLFKKRFFESGCELSKSSDKEILKCQLLDYIRNEQARIIDIKDITTENAWVTNTNADYTKLFNRKRLGIVVRVDKNLDPHSNIRPKILQSVCVDRQTCQDDVHELNEWSKAIMENIPEKRSYYPLQEFCAEQIVKRIGFMLHHYKGRTLESFTDFDFRIYTAKSNMLQNQTIKRLADENAKCFHAGIYVDKAKLYKLATTRVHKYLKTADVLKDLEQLDEDVRRHPDKLFLIVADDAHWGPNRQGCNDLVVNRWNDKDHPNVIVLQVTATPFNLLTLNSRIPSDIKVVENKANGNQLTRVRVIRRRVETLDGIDITKHSTSPKELHNVIWSESFEHRVRQANGLLVTLRIPHKIGQSAAWLCLGKKEIEEGEVLRKWIMCKDLGSASKVLLKFVDNYLEISSDDDEKWVLAVIACSNRKFLRFIRRERLGRNRDGMHICTKFECITDFNEGVIEFQSRMENLPESYLAFDECAVHLKKNPVEYAVGGTRVIYHYREYTFIIDSRGDDDSRCMSNEEEYMSLNFYFNSMRNTDTLEQLIRDDVSFENMCAALPYADDNEILAAEYGYYIITVNELREHFVRCSSCRIPINSEQIKSYVERKEQLLDQVHDRIEKERPGPIEKEAFRNVVENITAKAWEECKRKAEKMCKRTNMNKSDMEQFAEAYIHYVVHARQRDFSTNLTFIENQIKEAKCGEWELKRKLAEWTFDEKTCIACCQDKFETFRIVNDLLLKISSKDGINGHMKVVRVKNKDHGKRFYATLCLVRKLCMNQTGNHSNRYFFEVLKYFDEQDTNLRSAQCDSPMFRIWKVLQRAACGKCQCKAYLSNESSIKCTNCRHIHTKLWYLSDLDRLPCIVIVIDKCRAGDSYPQSLNVMDLRVCQSNKPPSLSSLMQELGRMCRYQRRESTQDYAVLPYALIHSDLVKRLNNGLRKGSSFYCAELDPDTYCKKKGKEPNYYEQGTSVVTARHYDFQNEKKHENRLLLHAEPQVGKTGVYLKTISLLRETIIPHGEINYANNRLEEYKDIIDYINLYSRLYSDGICHEDESMDNDMKAPQAQDLKNGRDDQQSQSDVHLPNAVVQNHIPAIRHSQSTPIEVIDITGSDTEEDVNQHTKPEPVRQGEAVEMPKCKQEIIDNPCDGATTPMMAGVITVYPQGTDGTNVLGDEQEGRQQQKEAVVPDLPNMSSTLPFVGQTSAHLTETPQENKTATPNKRTAEDQQLGQIKKQKTRDDDGHRHEEIDYFWKMVLVPHLIELTPEQWDQARIGMTHAVLNIRFPLRPQ